MAVPQWTTVCPFWEQVDDYGPAIRIGPGDSFDVSVETQVGWAHEVAEKWAQTSGVSLDAWAVSLEATLGTEIARSMSVTSTRSITYSRSFTNTDKQRRDRYVTLWRPAIRVSYYRMEDVLFRSSAAATALLSTLTTSETHAALWRLRGRDDTYASRSIEYSDVYQKPGDGAG